MHENRQGQEICLKSKLHIAVVEVLKERHVTNPPQLKLWLCIVLAVQFRGCDEARRASIRANVVNSLISLLKDPSSIVRASAALAIGELFGCVFENSEEEFMSRHLGSELKIVHDHILVLTSDFAVSPREEALYVTHTHTLTLCSHLFFLKKIHTQYSPTGSLSHVSFSSRITTYDFKLPNMQSWRRNEDSEV